MKKQIQFYSCSVCGQIITLVHKGGGRLVCCNRLMQEGEIRDKVKEIPKNAPYWSCSNCHYVLQGLTPPERCPSCGEHCHFIDVTCYIPECGFSGIDSRLIK